jgi:acyl-[acyl-carrier-protein]-phospholipid O-acyltransferase/long-chain-fatty-acid--[acyl-carrier-protein] ligase
MFSPQHLTFVGSLLDFAGTRLSQGYRRVLFRVCSSFLAASFYRRINRVTKIQAIITALIAATFYRYKAYGLEKLPQGGFLLVCNHTCIFDALLLQMVCPRPVRAITRADLTRDRWVKPILNLLQGSPILISNERSKESIREAVGYIKEGGIVCIYPEGELNRSGSILKLKKGFELIARMADCPIVPVWVDGLQDSIFSYRRGKEVLKGVNRRQLRAQVTFGDPISARSANNSVIRQKLMELGEFCFRRRGELGTHVGVATINSLKCRQFDTAFVDGRNGKRVSRVDLLAASIALSRWIRRQCPGTLVALAIPESTLQIVANIAIALANKVPAILNNSDGPALLRTMINRFQIGSVISCRSFDKRLPGLRPQTKEHDLNQVMADLKPNIFFWRIAAILMSPLPLRVLLGLPKNAGRSNASLFFTASRSGVPKKLVLSHANVMGTVAQLRAMLSLRENNVVAASPSFSYPQALIFTLWYPIIEGIQILYQSIPRNDSKRDVNLAGSEARVLIGAPRYIRHSLSLANNELLEDKGLVIAMQENFRIEFGKAFELEFGKKVYSAHSLKEIASAVTMNFPDPAKQHPDDSAQPSNRSGSAGKLAPGLAAQIRDPNTGEVASLYEPGMLWLKGMTLFDSVGDNSENCLSVAQDGWIKTGKIAHFDEDGFLFLKPELSRITPPALGFQPSSVSNL